MVREAQRQQGATRPPRMTTQVMPYQGSKRKIVNSIFAHLPRRVGRIVEPFAGSAAMTIHALENNRAKSAWINDSNEPLMELWRMIVQNPQALSDGYARLWNGQLGKEAEFFKTVRERFNRDHSPVDFLYLLARCVKAAVRYNAHGEFNNSPDNRRLGADPGKMGERIAKASEILSGRVSITCTDYRRVIDECTPEDLVYMDPPYQGTCGNANRRYLGSFSHEEFWPRLRDLDSKGVPFAISYDGHTTQKKYGETLPKSLNLRRILIPAGRSTQYTLLGKVEYTYESLYVSRYVK